MKTNPKKDKSARRKRNPLPVLGYAPDGRRGGYYRKVEQCKKCTLRSAITEDGLCAKCRDEKREDTIKQLGVDPADMTPVNNN